MSNPWSAGQTIDVAIIGAGAAGVAAARRLQSLRPDISVLLLEAKDRLGGRAWTVRLPSFENEPVDLGCGWLHGARTNRWTDIARQIGLTVETTPAPWSEGGRTVEGAGGRSAINTFFARAEQWGDSGEDGSLDNLLEPGNPWNGRIEAIGTFLNGVELAAASIHDYVHYDPGPGPDWRVREGYGTLISAYAQPVPTMLSTAVKTIDHRGAGTILLQTERGTLHARMVLVTVATNVIAEDRIKFDPPLPRKREAAGRLPLGLANKLFLSVTSPDDLPIDTRLTGSLDQVRTGSYQLRPFGTALIEAYYGGSLARDLEAAGEQAALAFAREELTQHFGTAFARRIDAVAMSAWDSEPHIGGSYSYAQPGASAERIVLGETVDGRLFFAGEACSPTRFSTAHGALETGLAAAEAIAAALKSKS
ncbi:NAD(P)/FAD-dependent oxidoreductase (plasmid) [Rhizobium sp. CB3090]|uniref:flavin monoamine oxidase family protein n=1 Tax=Rhizobium sp. CB3090 TaxID=3039156 RepID=UPI0024B08DDE|nr:NAD(P)/FAD-dependent oxidoreductase [Rhizobium sp. CB3090]WFU12647.1 NAD(P)/FAD-dependent oxidoreductase [Rhizobium sp. CB3090]